MGAHILKEKLMRWAMVLAGAAVPAGLIIVFVLALAPGTRDKPADYLTYSLEGLDRVPEDKILYREDAAVSVPVTGDEELYGVCLLPQGGLAVSGGRSVFVFDRRHTLLRTIAVGQAVLALGAGRGPAGTALYCALGDHIVVYAPDGRLLDEWAPLGERARLASIAVVDGLVYAADAGNKNITVFDRGGRMVRLIVLRTPECDGFCVPGICFDVAAGTGGVVWAADPGRRRVLKLSDKGDILASWGNAGPTLEGFSGCCNPANIALFPDGRFVVQEKGLLRIKLYDQSGRLTGFVAGPNSFHASLTLMDIAAAPNGVVYVVDTQRKAVRIFSPREAGS